MKTKIVCIFVCMLMMTVSVITAVPENKENNIESCSNLSEIVMFLQEPEIPENEPLSAISDTNEPWRAYEDFWDLTDPISEIRWWDTPKKRDGDKIIPSNPEGAVFTITLYEDDGTGKPGDIVCNYENIMPIITGTGIMYEFPSDPDVEGTFELYYYEAVLSSSCNLSDGWISIVKTDSIHDLIGGIIKSKDGNDNMCFYNTDSHSWSFYDVDLSFALVAYANKVSCDGLLSWTDVKPGSTNTGTIYVKNIGNPGSLLDWEIDSYPEWGTWTFDPESGDDLTPEDGYVTITVTVTAPDEKNSDFNGEVTIVNVNDPSDSCTIDVSLATPKNKPFIHNFPLLTWLCERFPNMFPMLRHILGQ